MNRADQFIAEVRNEHGRLIGTLPLPCDHLTRGRYWRFPLMNQWFGCIPAAAPSPHITAKPPLVDMEVAQWQDAGGGLHWALRCSDADVLKLIRIRDFVPAALEEPSGTPPHQPAAR